MNSTHLNSYLSAAGASAGLQTTIRSYYRTYHTRPSQHDSLFPMLPAGDGCATCGSKIYLLRCGSCHVVSYCSKAHQTSLWTSHKALCKPVKTCTGPFPFNPVRSMSTPNLQLQGPQRQITKRNACSFIPVISTRHLGHSSPPSASSGCGKKHVHTCSRATVSPAHL